MLHNFCRNLFSFTVVSKIKAMSTDPSHRSGKIFEYAEIDSTNEEMSRLLGRGDLEEGTVVRAGYQSAGKGHGGNTWSSERDKNLLFSILLKPRALRPEAAFHLSRITSLSIVGTLDRHSIGSSVKWPNDILVGSRKIAGILIENSISGSRISRSVIGVGLNVNQERFDPGIPAPTSMFLEKRCQFDMNLLLEDFRSVLGEWIRLLLAGDIGHIMKAYHDRLYLLGRTARFAAGGREFSGKIRGVLPGGELELELNGGRVQRYAFKEIELLGEIA